MAKDIKPNTRKTTTRSTTSSATGVRKTGSKTVPLPTEDQIRTRAYEIYLRRNGAPGDPAADWHQAERELRDELARARR